MSEWAGSSVKKCYHQCSCPNNPSGQHQNIIFIPCVAAKFGTRWSFWSIQQGKNVSYKAYWFPKSKIIAFNPRCTWPTLELLLLHKLKKSIKISQTESQPYNGEGSESWFRFNQQPTKNSRYIYRMQNMIWEEIKRIITVNNKTSDCLFAINPYFSHYGGGG